MKIFDVNVYCFTMCPENLFYYDEITKMFWLLWGAIFCFIMFEIAFAHADITIFIIRNYYFNWWLRAFINRSTGKFDEFLWKVNLSHDRKNKDIWILAFVKLFFFTLFNLDSCVNRTKVKVSAKFVELKWRKARHIHVSLYVLFICC